MSGFTLILYLCWKDTARYAWLSPGHRDTARACTSQDVGIPVDVHYSTYEKCDLASMQYIQALQRRPGWRQLSLTYECKRNG